MDWGYVAGYFDGEGHVAMHQQSRRRDMTRALVWYNTHERSLSAMQQFMAAGHINCAKRRSVYSLTIVRRSDILRVLEQMIPHLIIKRDTAIVLQQHLQSAPFREMSPNFGKVAATQTADLLYWYNEERLSLCAIAKKLGVTTGAVSRAFKNRRLPTRDRGWNFTRSDETRHRMSIAATKREAARRDTRMGVE